jgi:hypothetical protein
MIFQIGFFESNDLDHKFEKLIQVFFLKKCFIILFIFLSSYFNLMI